MLSKCIYCGWKLTRSHYSRCRKLKRKQGKALETLLALANEFGIPYHFIDARHESNTLDASEMQWTGSSLPVAPRANTYTLFMFAHEMAHWIHAPENKRSVYNFGMTNTSEDIVEEATVRLLEKTMLQHAGI